MVCRVADTWSLRQNTSINRGSSIRSASIELHRYLARPNKTPASTLPAGGLLLPQSLPPRALAVSANTPRGGGSCWSHAHSILQLWVEVKQGCGLFALTDAQYLLAYPSRRSRHDGPQSALVGGHQQAGQCSFKRAGGLDSAHGLDGAELEHCITNNPAGAGNPQSLWQVVLRWREAPYRAIASRQPERRWANRLLSVPAVPQQPGFLSDSI
jgi:hypothetical protein